MIRRELAVFLVVGVLTVAIDFVSYRGLLATGWLGIDPAKAAGFLIGTVFAYFANRLWTFGHHRPAAGSALRFALLYATTLAANVAVNAVLLAVLADWSYALQLAFLVATCVSAALNFLGMKLFVFRPGTTGLA